MPIQSLKLVETAQNIWFHVYPFRSSIFYLMLFAIQYRLLSTMIVTVCKIISIKARLSPPTSPKQYRNMKDMKLPACLVANDRNSRCTRSFNRVHRDGLWCKTSLSMHTLSELEHTTFVYGVGRCEGCCRYVSATNPVHLLSTSIALNWTCRRSLYKQTAKVRFKATRSALGKG